MTESKVEVNLPEQLLRLLDAECKRLTLTRNEFVRRAAIVFLAQLDEEAERNYVESYLKDPDKSGSDEAHARLATETFKGSPGYEGSSF